MTAFIKTPRIEKNPNSRAPLVAIVYFKVELSYRTPAPPDDSMELGGLRAKSLYPKGVRNG